VIWNSDPYKRELAHLAFAFRKRKSQKRWTHVSETKLERDAFYMAFSIRKLIEAFKVSDKVEMIAIEAIEYPTINRVVDLMNWHRIDQLFDLSKPKPCKKTIIDFCNQIIHSFIFLPCVGDGNNSLFGLFISSDRLKVRSLLYFDIDRIIEMIDAVISDEIVSMELKRESAVMPIMVVKKSCKVRGRDS
jgi:hypothetical protein